MAGVRSVPTMVCIYTYKGHKFYENWLNPGGTLVHLDPKGREVNSKCYDEDDAHAYIDDNYKRQ